MAASQRHKTGGLKANAGLSGHLAVEWPVNPPIASPSPRGRLRSKALPEGWSGLQDLRHVVRGQPQRVHETCPGQPAAELIEGLLRIWPHRGLPSVSTSRRAPPRHQRALESLEPLERRVQRRARPS